MDLGAARLPEVFYLRMNLLDGEYNDANAFA